MKKFICTVASVAVALSFSFVIPVSAAGIGDVLLKKTTSFPAQTTLDFIQSDGPAGKLNTYLLSGSQKNIEIIPYFGDYITTSMTLSEMVTSALQKGYRVIGAINGDFFESTGHTRGLLVQSGRLILSGSEKNFQDQHWRTLGIKKNGSIIQGESRISANLKINGKSSTNINFNRPREAGNIFIYSYDYGKTTKENDSSVDVVLNIKSGNFTLGQTTVATVEKVVDNAKNTAIGSNQMVLSVTKNDLNQSFIQQFLSLHPGDTVEYAPRFTNSAWNDVIQATGGPDYLVKDGSYLPGGLWMTYANSYPSTAVGFKPDGTAFFLQADGRGSGGSAGIHPSHVATYFQSIGCNQALMLDGGGSSEIVMVENGKAVIKNSPSDGSERRVASALLMVEKDSAPIPPSPPPMTSDTPTSSTQAPSGKPNDDHGGTTAPGQDSADASDPAAPSDGASSSVIIPPKEETQSLPYPTDDILDARYIKQIIGLKKGYSIIKQSTENEFLYEWLFYGKSLSGKGRDINLSIIQGSEYEEQILMLSNQASGHFIRFKETEKLPGKSTLRYGVADWFAENDIVNVYGYDQANNCLVEIATNYTVKDGTLTFSFEIPMDMFITTQKLAIESIDSKAPAPKNNLIFIWIGLGIVILAGGASACWFICKKRNKAKEETINN
ncbi:MAG: phosphodiester glycosidase family protein [Oscillospiraceae bacterium]